MIMIRILSYFFDFGMRAALIVVGGTTAVLAGTARCVYNSLRALHSIGIHRNELQCKEYLDHNVVYRTVVSPPTEHIGFQPVNVEYNDWWLKVERSMDGKTKIDFGTRV